MKKPLLIFDLDDTLYDTSMRIDENTPNFAEMKLYPDAKNFLESSSSEKILVTYGDVTTQEKKIETLGIRDYFSEIYICRERQEKLDCFKKILGKYKIENLKAILVIGDRIDSEIKYGNILGMTTVLLWRGKYKELKPKDENEIPDFKVQDFEELLKLLAGGR